MTYQSPRIYLYKITFEEVPYYYYGVKKEKYFNQEYWGSPVTHKWCWELYTPKKQILELFDYTDEGYIKAQEVEKRIIAPVLNDKWCLNENVGGNFSLKVRRETGRKIGLKHKENGTGVFSITPERKIEIGKNGGAKGGKKSKELGVGVHSLSKEQIIENAIKGGNRCKELNVGIFAISPERRSEISKRNGKISVKIINAQRWECLETGYISTAAGVVSYQKGRGIDTSKENRRRIS